MDKNLKQEGTVTGVLPNLQFKVKLDDGRQVLAHSGGKLRMYRIKILEGDRVTVELSAYDETRGRIVWRGKK